MAYTAVVEKQAVSKIGDSLYSVSIKLTVNDGTSDIFETSASARYNHNAPDLANVKASLISELASKWDKYAAEHNIYGAVAFDTMVNEIQTSANTYINQ